MRRLILVFVIALGQTHLPAQQQELDSLLPALKKHPQNDTVKLNLLNDITFYYSFINPDKGIETADQAILLAQALNNSSKLASAYSNKGVNYAAKGQDSLALAAYQKALTIHSLLDNKKGMANVLNNMAIIETGHSNYAQALDYYRKSLVIYEELGDKKRMANALNNTGVVYLYMADYPKALEYYLQALQLLEKLGDNLTIANALTNVGIIYKNLSQYSKALEFYSKAMQLFEQAGYQQGIANTYGNIGVLYDKIPDREKALENYQRALALNKSIGNQKHIAGDLANIGVLYSGKDDLLKAVDYLQQSLTLYEATGDKHSMAFVLNHLGDLYSRATDEDLLKMGVQPGNRFSKVMEYLQRSLQISRETGAPDRLSEAWKNLSKAYEQQKDFDNALQAYKQFIVFRDSIYNVEKQKQVARKEMQYEFEKKEVLAAANLNRQRLIKNIVIGAAALLALAAFTSFLFYKRKRDAEARKKEAELKADVAETELKVRQLQMNPHFLFNSLNSISDYINRNKIPEADRYLAKFAKLMRHVLENADKKEVSLANDLQALELYIQLEQLRMNNQFAYEIITDDSIDSHNTLVPPLLLQPFVENSIWHGFAGKPTPGKITIRVQAGNNRLCCTITDNGIGRKQASARQQFQRTGAQSMGLKITQARLDIINRLKHSDASVVITDLTNGTKAVISLPLELCF